MRVAAGFGGRRGLRGTSLFPLAADGKVRGNLPGVRGERPEVRPGDQPPFWNRVGNGFSSGPARAGGREGQSHQPATARS